MASHSHSPSSSALVAFPFITPHDRTPNLRSTLVSAGNTIRFDEEQWQPILHSSNQVVLYNPRSHALSIAAASSSSSEAVLPGVVVARRQRRESADRATRAIGDTCPYCKQTLPADFAGFHTSDSHVAEDEEFEGRWDDNVDSSADEYDEVMHSDPAYHLRAPDYFRLLAIANETSSRRPSRSPSPYRVDNGESTMGTRDSRTRSPDENRSTAGAFPAEKMAEGYFKTFFQEEYKLGMGANGTVFLCQHVLDGNPLGHFAVKKIAVGESHSYLLKILKEVRLLERLHHPNIITYHHAWLENSQFSSFGPKVPTLHVLMQWAEGGSLDDFIDVRLGRKAAHPHMHPFLSTTSTFGPSVPSSPDLATEDLPHDLGRVGEPTTPSRHARFTESPSPGVGPQPQLQQETGTTDTQSRSARIRAFRAYQHAPPEEKEHMRREMETLFGAGFAGGRAVSPGAGPAGAGGGAGRKPEWKSVHLLSALEVKSLFRDVVEGLAFLHDKSILHLDLKPGNVLLTWDEGKLIPRAMLSDFGTSRDMINSTRTPRSGNTGTLEYTAPETLPSPHTGLLQQIDSKADMWSLGMILHKLLFFKLPYRYAAAGDATGDPISREDEAVKMDNLEKEVLEYPGFKSTPTLVLGFEARRLPRSFLVLLESLLHKSPGGRPSVERVSTAIREGKLDPLEGPVTPTTLSLGRPRGNTVITTPGPVVPAVPTAEALSSEATRLLALPPPADILGPEQARWRRWLGRAFWMYHSTLRLLYGSDALKTGPGRTRRPDSLITTTRWRVGMRVLRSSLLVGKVLSIMRMCRNPGMCPKPWAVVLLFTGALADTVVDHEAMYHLTPRESLRVVHDREQDGKGLRRERRRLLQRRAMKSVCITVGLALLHVAFLGMSALDLHGGMVGGVRSLFFR